MRKVIAVTVTYNDFEYLKRCLEYLKKQSYQLTKIIVVDNCSTEENRKKLKAEESDLIEVVWLQENLGGAGGFQKGVEHAIENFDFDWVWLMDADAFPKEDCLENLLKYEGEENIGCLCPLIFGDDLKEWQLYHHKLENKWLFHDKQAYLRYEDVPIISNIDADAFVGPLIKRNVIDDVGVPMGGLFIYGDDLEYTYRISQKYKVKLIKAAVICHRDQPIHGVQKPNNWWKDYYTYRNRIIFIKKYGKNGFCRFVGVCLLKLSASKQIIKCRFSKLAKPLKAIRIKLYRQAIKDGRNGKLGKTVDPKVFNEQLKKVL